MVEIDRFKEFRKQFSWMYSVLKNSYDIQNEDLFGGILKAYYDRSGAVKTEKFQELMVSFGSKFPSPDDYSRAVGEFVYKCDREEAIIDSAPPPKLTKKELGEVKLQNDIITGLWPLMKDDVGRGMIARLYGYTCYKNGYKLPDYWKSYLLCTPFVKLTAEYFELKPITKKEMRLIGLEVEKNGISKGKSDFRKVGEIVFGNLLGDNR